LQASLKDTFLPQENILLTFNYPVELSELQKNLTLYSPDFEKKETSNWTQLDADITPVLLSENQFIIKPKS